MNTRLVPICVAILGAAVFVSPAQAQRRFGGVSRGGGARIRFVHQRSGRFFVGSAFSPYFYSDYDFEPGLSEAPPFIMVRDAQQASPAPVSNPPDSLVLELQGDHWVRVTNFGQSQTGGQSNEPGTDRASNLRSAMPPDTLRRTQTEEPPAKLPPAVLVFRDGHKEEIGKYTIMGATIYTSADYWSSGSWTRQIQIARLDVPATLKLNQERGAKFSLPSGPNEVMIRP